MKFKITKHLEALAKRSQAVKNQFYPSTKEEVFSKLSCDDPLQEDSKYLKSKGLIHKYPKRALFCITSNCAAYCRFCTRRRKAETQENERNENDVLKAVRFLKANEKVNEVIFSGGDPLTAPALLEYSLDKFCALSQIKIIRIHTRLPVSDPKAVNHRIPEALAKIQNKAVYVVVHFEHPHEITPDTIAAIKSLQKSGAIVLAQSVFLKGINDSYDVLFSLFNGLLEIGVRPYMIGHCDLVKGAEHFIVPLEKEIKIMTQLRKNISGIAFPTHVIDAPNGCGKVTVPQNFWDFKKKDFLDFNDKKIKTY